MLQHPAEAQPDRDGVTRELLLRRDPEGLRRLLADYGGKVTWWLRREFSRALGDPEVEEALYAAAHRAWTQIATHDPARGTLRGWFYTIARRSALKILQREKRQRHEPLSVEPASGIQDLLAPSDVRRPEPRDRRFLADLEACIFLLAPMQRRVVEADLRAGGIADASELAEELGTTQNSIYVSRSNARKALRRCLAAKGHDLAGLPDGRGSDSDKAQGS